MHLELNFLLIEPMKCRASSRKKNIQLHLKFYLTGILVCYVAQKPLGSGFWKDGNKFVFRNKGDAFIHLFSSFFSREIAGVSGTKMF